MKHIIFTLFVIAAVLPLAAQSSLEVTATQNSLVTKHTATWCPFCGTNESWNLQQYFADSLDGKGAIVLTAHRSNTSSLYSVAGKDLLANFQGVVYQPEFFFNTTRIDGNEDAIKASILSKVGQASAQTSLVQSGLIANYISSTDSLMVSTKTKFFDGAEGEFRLAILIVEKEVMATQASRTGLQKHKRVVRGTLTPDVDGIELVNGSVALNTEFNHNFTIKWDNRYDLNNVEFVTLIWKRNTTNNRLEFVNTNAVTQVQTLTTSTKTVDFLANRFVVTPNPAREKMQIRLDMPATYNNADITLLNIHGKVVKTIYRGALNSGEQVIDLQRNTLPSGIYLVRLRADGQMATRKVLLQ